MSPSVRDPRLQGSIETQRARLIGIRLLVLTILAIPSLWLLFTVPPLWRDSDGYNQITTRPGGMTIVHFPPLYCFLSRLPLYLGSLCEGLRSGAPLPSADFFRTPVLTDTGIFLLLATQHTLLLSSQAFLLRAMSLGAVTELVSAVLLAANASFYSFAHCVGSEAFSLAATIWLLALCLRIMRLRRPKARDWCWLGASLAACILSRHINALLVLVLPGACLFAAGFRMMRSRSAGRPVAVRWLRKLAVALFVGAISVLVAKAAVRLLSDEFHVKIRSTLGFTFLWRLKFLSELDEKQRAALLADWQAKAHDADTQQVFSVVAAALTANGKWDPVRIHAAVHDAIRAAEPRRAVQRVYRAENELTKTVLFSAPPAYIAAVRKDFATSLLETPAGLARAPFETTLYCFERFQELPQLTGLRSFREPSTQTLLAKTRDGPYYRLMNLPYLAAVAVWLAITLAAFARRTKDHILSLSAAVVFVAFVMLLLNCALTEFLPRYTLAFWNLVFIGILLQLPASIDVVAGRFRSIRR